MRTLICNIKELILATNTPVNKVQGAEMSSLPIIKDAYVIIDDEIIFDYGPMSKVPESNFDKRISAKDSFVLPTWCDSHTHLIFAATREGEFIDKIQGASYEDIAQKGGGILNSAKKLQETSEELLLESAYNRLIEVQSFGTGAIEIKSGYGLTVDAELKMLRVIQKLKNMTKMPIKASFLGAHALPLKYKKNRAGYIDLIINEMLPRIAAEGLADYIDVFCEKVAFSVAETEKLMKAGAQYGLKPKVHTNQFNCMGGIQACVAHNAISVDHLEVINDDEIACLLKSSTMATLLPSAPFFLNDNYPKARKMIDAGMAVALATDYNPGSTPSGKIPFVLSLACIKMKMLPEEAINAATVNGAYAMELSDKVGSISKGKLANLIITKPMDSLAFMPYAFGTDWIDRVIIAGQV
ncbi:MAG: imidazolonepropionase [Saprospiraceae bacterium]|nr:imidazolonepropionase [Saprospiraceae bacterium]